MLDEKKVREIWKAVMEDEKLLTNLIKDPKKLKKQFSLTNKEAEELQKLIEKKVSIKEILGGLKSTKALDWLGGAWPVELPWLKIMNSSELTKKKKSRK